MMMQFLSWPTDLVIYAVPPLDPSNNFMYTGVTIEYLPSYSPDLNLIKEAFSKIKHFIRRHNIYYNLTIGDGILFDMYEVIDIITPEDADGYFLHAGYF